MVTADVDLEHRVQLREAGRLLADPPDSVPSLLHILDQLERLLSMVDQSPDSLMIEAYALPMNALVDGNLLEHSNIDVKVSVAACLCEIKRITAPQTPYNDEVMKRVFQCIVSSLEDLSDKSSRSYTKRISILETLSKVKSYLVMLDLELDGLIVKLFEHFLNSVRDHHLGDAFSSMVNIMAPLLDESDNISLDMLKPLLASVKTNSEGVLPVARKLGEEVIRKSADKLRPYLNNAMTIFGDSLVDYSPVLISVCEGTINFVVGNDKSASVQPKVVDATPAIVSSDDAAQVINNETMVTKNKDVNDQQKPKGAIDHRISDLTRKLDTTKVSGTENSGNVESNPDKTTKSAKSFVSETVHGETRAEKSPEVVISLQKPSESEVANAPSKSGSQREPQSKITITKGIRSKKKGKSQTDPPSMVVALTNVSEVLSDQDIRSPKRARKKTPKAVENKPSITTGSDVETLKNIGKKAETGDSGPKPAKRSRKKVASKGSAAKKSKLSVKKVSEPKKSKQDDKKVVEAADSVVKPAKRSLKKGNETNSDAKPLKQSGKRGQKRKIITKPVQDISNKDEETDSDITPLKLPESKEEKSVSDHKALNSSEDRDDEETDSDNIPLLLSAKRAKKSGSSVVTSSLKNKDGKKQESGKKTVEVKKDQTKSLSEDDDGMDVSLKSALKKVTKGKKGNVKGALSTGSKRKRSVTKKKVTGAVKYDDSLVGQKVKVWWPDDKMYYEGVIESFDSATKKHKVLYLDNEEEVLSLQTEKWEILKKFSTPSKAAVQIQNTDALPEIAGGSKGESKVTSEEVKEVESKEDEESKKEEKPKKITYSRGRKGSNKKTKSSDGNVEEKTEAGDASEEPENGKVPKIGSKSGSKRKKKN